jgi:hypothetical protein
MLQSYERPTWSIYVRFQTLTYFSDKSSDASSKWFLLAIGPENMYKMLAGFEDKSTQAVCTFAYSEGPGHEPIIFQGRTDVNLFLEKYCKTAILTERRANWCLPEDRLYSVSVHAALTIDELTVKY